MAIFSCPKSSGTVPSGIPGIDIVKLPKRGRMAQLGVLGGTLKEWIGERVAQISATRLPFTNAEKPRTLPWTGHQLISLNVLIDEERLQHYVEDHFYPVHLGEVFKKRYQVLSKLGYGSTATVWLARDLKVGAYVGLKIHSRILHGPREPIAYERINAAMGQSECDGKHAVRALLDMFYIRGPFGAHLVLVFEPAQTCMSRLVRAWVGHGFPPNHVKGITDTILLGLTFLHGQHCEVVHGDLHLGNVLLGLEEQGDGDVFSDLEEMELNSPSARKCLPTGRTIYCRQGTNLVSGPLWLSDFGQSRLGRGPHSGKALPRRYRPPEVVLEQAWSFPVDLWCIGLMVWEMMGLQPLFDGRDENGDVSDAAHLAQFIAVMGPPPIRVVQRNEEKGSQYWSKDATIPEEGTLESLASKVDNNAGFLAFIRRVITWIPENRPSAQVLLQDPWLRIRDREQGPESEAAGGQDPETQAQSTQEQVSQDQGYQVQAAQDQLDSDHGPESQAAQAQNQATQDEPAQLEVAQGHDDQDQRPKSPDSEAQAHAVQDQSPQDQVDDDDEVDQSAYGEADEDSSVQDQTAAMLWAIQFSQE